MGRIEPVAREKTRWRVLAFSGWHKSGMNKASVMQTREPSQLVLPPSIPSTKLLGSWTLRHHRFHHLLEACQVTGSQDLSQSRARFRHSLIRVKAPCTLDRIIGQGLWFEPLKTLLFPTALKQPTLVPDLETRKTVDDAVWLNQVDHFRSVVSSSCSPACLYCLVNSTVKKKCHAENASLVSKRDVVGCLADSGAATFSNSCTVSDLPCEGCHGSQNGHQVCSPPPSQYQGPGRVPITAHYVFV